MRKMGKVLAKPFVALGSKVVKGARIIAGRQLSEKQKRLAFGSIIKRKGKTYQTVYSRHSGGAIRSYGDESFGKETAHELTGTGGFRLSKRKYERLVEHHEGDENWHRGIPLEERKPQTKVVKYDKFPLRTREYDGNGRLVRQTVHTKKGDKEWEYSPPGRFKGKRVRAPKK